MRLQHGAWEGSGNCDSARSQLRMVHEHRDRPMDPPATGEPGVLSPPAGVARIPCPSMEARMPSNFQSSLIAPGSPVAEVGAVR